MPKEFSRVQRVADYLQRELAILIQREVRDPRVGMVSITGVDVSLDLPVGRIEWRLSCGRRPAARREREVARG